MQTSPEASNNWHYVSISRQNSSLNIFTWKNKAGVEWDLIFVEEESSGVFKFNTGENNPYYNYGYTYVRLIVKDTTEIRGPPGHDFTFTKRLTKTLGQDTSLTNSIRLRGALHNTGDIWEFIYQTLSLLTVIRIRELKVATTREEERWIIWRTLDIKIQ